MVTALPFASVIILHSYTIPVVVDNKYATTREDSNGFGRALYDAVGRPNLLSQRSAPVVVISHVDADHIGGLYKWAEHVLERATDWKNARTIVEHEVSEVWCNIPPNERAFAEGVGLPLSKESGDEPNLLDYREMDPVHRIAASIEGGKGNSFLEAVKQFRLREHFSRLTFGAPDEREVLLSEVGRLDDRLERERQTKNAEWFASHMKEAFPEQKMLIDNLFGLSNIRHFQHPFVFESSLDSHIEVQIAVDYPHLYLRLSTRSTGTSEDGEGQFGVYGSWASKNGETSVPPLWLGKVDNKIPLVSVTLGGLLARGTPRTSISEVAKIFTKLAEILEQCDSFRQRLEVCLAFAREHAGDAPDTIEKITILEMYLGLFQVDETVRNLDLFVLLNRLKISIISATLDKVIDPEYGFRPNIGGLPVDVVAPSSTEIEKLFEHWPRYAKRYQVSIPGYLLRAQALAQVKAWQPDTSVSNLSSIALWLRKVGRKSSVVLTGDGRHDRIIEEITRTTTINPRNDVSRFYYQIPHHGGGRNTDVSQKKHLPHKALNHGRKITLAFASGGNKEISTTNGTKGPLQNVVQYYERAARRVWALRSKMKESSYFDIRLT